LASSGTAEVKNSCAKHRQSRESIFRYDLQTEIACFCVLTWEDASQLAKTWRMLYVKATTVGWFLPDFRVRNVEFGRGLILQADETVAFLVLGRGLSGYH
jgi:hypothetical protein